MKRDINTRMDEDDIARSKIVTDPKEFIKEAMKDLFMDDIANAVRKTLIMEPLKKTKIKKGKK